MRTVIELIIGVAAVFFGLIGVAYSALLNEPLLLVACISGGTAGVGLLIYVVEDAEPCSKQELGYNCHHRENECDKEKK